MSTTKPETSSRASHRRGQTARGRRADAPGDLPAPGWRDVLLRTKNELAKDNLSIVAAGVAFYCFMAFVPMLGAIVSTYGLVADPVQVSEHAEALAQVVPAEVMPLLREQMQRLTSAGEAAGIGALVSLLLAVYASAKATKALITGLNIAYDEEERRGFVRLQAVALALTLGAVLGAVLALGLVAVLPSVAGHLGWSDAAGTAVNWLRWPLLVGGFMLGLGVLYRFGPSRNPPQWRWLSAGAVVATGLWIVASLGFSFYVSTLGNYEKTYGSLGALVVFLLWLYLTGYVVLLGAELNAEMERQTEKDTTAGEPKPLGQRDAYSADTVGPTPE
ncbi:YihY/virulence factor BrkB family protein [Opitutus terrae]|uniref:Ribonuclease BN n=1 Tax=Opitutus terrae (strain DSM 11246 / JCM 15787 / PB90-1) TaxID=452637 RepID=B1ZRG7_OPITP|nr:YihY/virulence factor BrkB family protein [Opitutus terrae]ACB77617.1 ribonuclease BN [Opitutus terrae PB90-1]